MEPLIPKKTIPALARRLSHRPVVFADNATMSLKPQVVIDHVKGFYENTCADVHREAHLLSEEADGVFQQARRRIAELIHAHPSEIIFTRNATEAMFLAGRLVEWQDGDRVLVPLSEHRSNIGPWPPPAEVDWILPGPDGRLRVDGFVHGMGPRTRLVTVAHVSNITGMIAPVREIVAEARKRGALTLVDAAQSVGYLPVDVRSLACDFLAFSGHKMLGPSGVGVLYARHEILKNATPVIYAGEDSPWDSILHRFEAGTPNFEGVLGLGAAVELLTDIGLERIEHHSRRLADELVRALYSIPRVRLVPESRGDRLPIVCFDVEGLESTRVATLLSQRFGILIRSSVRCAEPLARHWGSNGWCRISLYLYNSLEDIERIGEAVAAAAETARPKQVLGLRATDCH